MVKVKKIIIKPEKKEFIKDLNKEVTVQKFEKYSITDTSKDFHTKYGIIKKDFFKKKDGSKIKVKNNEYVIFSPSFIDSYKKIQRSPQIIPLKDIGRIISETGINKNSIILDAGSGSGGLALFLASIAKKVTTYDIKEWNTELIEQNIKDLELKNIEAKTADIYNPKEIKEKDIDVFTLDVPEPWKAVKTAEKVLKIGGFLVNYSPTIPTITDFVEAIKKNPNFIIIKTIEIIERQWEFDKRKIRPKSSQIAHSGFLTFVRKI